MGPMSLGAESLGAESLGTELQQQLIGLAAQSIQYGLQQQSRMPLKLEDYDGLLKKIHATFVTLSLNGKLRGCIGTLEAHQTLVESVVSNAYSAAFNDPRFSALRQQEVDNLHIEISVLSAPQVMSFASEDDLISQLRPGIDGIILEEGHHRATYLPSVWAMLSEPEQFIRELKSKAGLSSNHWSSKIKVSRYTTECFA